ncbi:hypothetical protein [Haloferax sp. ATB1]|uniref:hypothetical protein n=1 Tax=Haloferax sp. ATB1 TaxID=1508454 RepID=UPI001F515FDE|nr:hypothetical protein [Haloferax sp. ATB1]
MSSARANSISLRISQKVDKDTVTLGDVVPPSTTPDFILAGVALTGSSFWLLWTRKNSLNKTLQALVTVFALVGVTALLFMTLHRFGYFDAVLYPRPGFSEPTPLWQVLPAIGAEIASILALSFVITRRKLGENHRNTTSN